MIDASLQWLWADCYYNHTWITGPDGADPPADAPPVMDYLLPGQSTMTGAELDLTLTLTLIGGQRTMPGAELGIVTADDALQDPEIQKHLTEVNEEILKILKS